MSISSRVDIGPIKIGSNCTFFMGGWEPESPLSAGRFDILPSDVPIYFFLELTRSTLEE